MKPGAGDIGIRRWATNQAITSAGLQATGLAAAKIVLDGIVGPRHAGQEILDADEVYESGFVGAFSFKPSSGGGLVIDVRQGIGVYSRADLGEVDGVAGTSPGDAVDPTVAAEDYTPNTILFSLDEEASVTLDAHDAQPRIDVVYAVVSFDTDDPETVRIRPAGPGSSVSTANVDQRLRFTATIAVAKGTASGSPAVPSIPAYALRIAHVHVPATSGSVTIKDARPLLRATGSSQAVIPDQNAEAGFSYARDVIASELDVTAGAGGDKIVVVASGFVDIDGARRHVTGGNIELDAADGSNPRWDLVWLKALRRPTGSVQVELGYTTGTPAADPSRPAVPANCHALAYVWRATSDNTIADADIYDARALRPYTTGDHVEFTIPLVHFRVQVGAQPPNPDPDEHRRTVTLTAYRQDGTRHYGKVYCLVQTWGDNSDPSNIEDDHASASNITLRTDDVSAGTVVSTSSVAAVLRTDQFGRIEGLKVVDPAAGGGAGTGWVTIRAIAYLDAVNPASSYADSDELISGTPNLVRVTFS